MNCPICGGALQSREIAPCYDCGDRPSELEELRRAEHRYRWYRVFGQRIVLCDFCDADFGSYFPEYFGLPPGPCGDYGLEPLEPVAHPKPAIDACCSTCKHRLAFLLFLQAAREFNAA